VTLSLQLCQVKSSKILGKTSTRFLQGLGDGAFDGNVIDLSIIVSLLPFVIEISVGAFGNCENCAMGGETVDLLQRLADLQWRWCRWVGFWLGLLVGIVWHWIGDL
jgi:hypothetical protein